MRRICLQLQTMAVMIAALAAAHLASAQTFWNGGGGDMNWSTAGNWSSGSVPSFFDAVVFTNAGAVATVSNINNIVDSGFGALGGSIVSLQYASTNGSHTTLISSGQTLTISGGLTVGTEQDNGPGVGPSATITGPGGALNLTGGSLIVRQACANSGSALRATNDLSGLQTFTATISRLLLGSEGSAAPRPAGILYLAQTNTITANGSAPAIAIGGRGGNNNNGGNASFLYLGQTNVILANSISVGRGKQSQTSSIRFNTTAFANPVAYFRGSDGTSRASTWNIADAESISGTVNTTGSIDFTGGRVDALVDTILVGRSSTGVGAGYPVGTLTLSQGIIDVNTLQIGVEGSSSTNYATGTVNVNGGTLKVNTTLGLGVGPGGIGVTGAKGTLNINGGTVLANAISANSGGTNNIITMTNGTLVITNTAGPGINTFAMTNSALAVPALNTGAAVVVTNLLFGGATNKLNIVSIPVVAGYPVQCTLVKYTASSGIATVGLGTLPSSLQPYAGYLSNNVANSSIDLIVTAGPAPARFIFWNGTPTGDWDVATTANWKTANNVATIFNQTDFVQFDDSASGITTVNLTDKLDPTSLTVSNNTKTYTFSGSGYIDGAVGVVKQGSGTLIIDNTGINTFTGGLTINGGTVQFGNNDYNVNLPATAAIIDNGTLAFNQLGDITVANTISGAGAVATASGTLRLAGANSFTGAVTVLSGTLVPANNSALGTSNGPTIINSGATLDVGASGAAADAVDIRLEPIIVSGSGVDGSGAIVNSGSTQTKALGPVTLTGDTTFGGSGRWDIRSASGKPASLSTGGNPCNITKVGINQVSLVGVGTIDPALGDINVTAGTFAIQLTTTQVGDPNKTITVSPSAVLELYNLSTPLNKKVVLNSDGFANAIYADNGNSTISGPVTLNTANQICIINVTGPSLNLSDSVSGPGTLYKQGGGTLLLSGAASPDGGTYVQLGTLIVNGTLSGGVTNSSFATNAGYGTINGVVDISGGLNPGNINGAGTLTANVGTGPGNGLILESGAALIFDLTATNSSNGGVNDLLQVNGDLNTSVLGNQIYINPFQGRLQAGTYHLINFTGSILGAGFYPPSSIGRYSFTFSTNGSYIDLNVAGNPVDLKWASTFDSTWDVGVNNWINLATSAPDAFQNGDTVLLDDSVAGVTNTLSLASGVAVLPWAITNDSSANNYTILGAGKISGGTGLLKKGSSTLTILSTNDFTGPVNVLAGTLKVGSSGALGATNSGTTIASGATLDVGATNMAQNVLNLGFEQITVSGSGVGGNGAIISSGTNQQQNALRFVTLTGHTTFGGTVGAYWIGNLGRWDIRGTGNTDIATNTSAVLSTGGNPYNLTKVGSNVVCLVGLLVDPALADITIKQGALSIEHATTLGDPSRTLTVSNGATLQVWQTWPSNLLNKVIALYGDGVNTNIYTSSGNNFIVGPVTLNSDVQNSNCVFGAVGATLTFSNNTISGSAGLTKVASGTINLYGANTYTGDTLVSAGTLGLGGSSTLSASPNITIASGATLDVSARNDGTLALVGSQVLTGNGIVNGALTVGPGATVSPGIGGIGALTVSNSVTLQGTTTLDLGAGTNDVIRAGASINYGGTLNLVFTPGTLAAGNSFKLFSANNNGYTGSFNVTPATPGSGLKWNTNLLGVSGTLAVETSVNPNPTNITAILTGNQWDLSWPADHTGWRLQAQTNAINVGLSTNWVDVAGATSTNHVVVPINAANGSVFYRMVYP